MTDPPISGWFSELVDSEIDSLHRHVRLVYPFASTEQTVHETFRRAAHGAASSTAPTVRSWLRRLARTAVLSGASDAEGWQRRNASLIQLEFRDSAEGIDDPEVQRIALDLAARFENLSGGTLELLRMLAIEALDLDEVAHVLDVAPDTAQELVENARVALRRLGQVSNGESTTEEGVW